MTNCKKDDIWLSGGIEQVDMAFSNDDSTAPVRLDCDVITPDKYNEAKKSTVHEISSTVTEIKGTSGTESSVLQVQYCDSNCQAPGILSAEENFIDFGNGYSSGEDENGDISNMIQRMLKHKSKTDVAKVENSDIRYWTRIGAYLSANIGASKRE